MTIYEAVDTISKELSELVSVYFDPTAYPELDFESDAFDRRVKRALFDLLHECNRLDLPDSARVPFLQLIIEGAMVDAYEAGVIAPDMDAVSRVKPQESVSVKSTSVSFGKSDYEILRDDRKDLYAEMRDELDRKWYELMATLRKLRW